MYFQKYRLRKTWLDICLKSRLPEDPSTDNMANGRNHCGNMKDSTFPIFINHCGGNYVAKSSFSEIQNPKAVC